MTSWSFLFFYNFYPEFLSHPRKERFPPDHPFCNLLVQHPKTDFWYVMLQKNYDRQSKIVKNFCVQNKEVTNGHVLVITIQTWETF
jgi:hypothetical protein